MRGEVISDYNFTPWSIKNLIKYGQLGKGNSMVLSRFQIWYHCETPWGNPLTEKPLCSIWRAPLRTFFFLQISKCCKICIFGSNFLPQKLQLQNFITNIKSASISGGIFVFKNNKCILVLWCWSMWRPTGYQCQPFVQRQIFLVFLLLLLKIFFWSNLQSPQMHFVLARLWRWCRESKGWRWSGWWRFLQ